VDEVTMAVVEYVVGGMEEGPFREVVEMMALMK